MTQAKMPEPMFWFRPRSDGGYEGPLHDAIIGEVRKQSGAWIPFFSASQVEAYAAAKVRDALEEAAEIADRNNDFSTYDAIRALIPPLPGPVEPTT